MCCCDRDCCFLRMRLIVVMGDDMWEVGFVDVLKDQMNNFNRFFGKNEKTKSKLRKVGGTKT